MPEHILVIDAGTTSTRAMVFALDGTLLRVAQAELSQHYPRPGWVEHDAAEIWTRTLACAREVAGERAPGIAAIGITNQRETTLLWNADSGKPVHNAIVWQDRRTTERVEGLEENGMVETIREKTGLEPTTSSRTSCSPRPGSRRRGVSRPPSLQEPSHTLVASGDR